MDSTDFIQNIYVVAKQDPIIRSSLTLLKTGTRNFYVSIPHLISWNHSFFSLLFLSHMYKFEKWDGTYELTDGETDDGLDEAFSILHDISGRIESISLPTYISLHKWLIPIEKYKLDISSLKNQKDIQYAFDISDILTKLRIAHQYSDIKFDLQHNKGEYNTFIRKLQDEVSNFKSASPERANHVINTIIFAVDYMPESVLETTFPTALLSKIDELQEDRNITDELRRGLQQYKELLKSMIR